VVTFLGWFAVVCVCVEVVLTCRLPDGGLLGLTRGSPFGWVPEMSYPKERMFICLCYHLSSSM